MINKFRIVLDQDQVICDWVGKILEWYNKDKKTSFTKEQIVSWDVASNLGYGANDFIRSCMRYPEFYRDLEEIEGAVAGVKNLIDRGHDVVIATAVPKCAGIAYHGKLEWIRRNMPYFNLNNFIAIHRKDLLSGDIMLDDGLHNIIPWINSSNNYKGYISSRMGIIFDCAWNREYVVDNRLSFRIKNWNEFIEHIQRFEREGSI